MSTTTEKHPLAGKHIIIAGAGTAGLAVIRALNLFWPSHIPRPHITCYERDERHIPRSRGNYSLGLRSDSASRGMQALQELQVFNSVFDARVAGSEASMMIRDRDWKMIMQAKGPATPPDGLPASRMRITRHDLRECLIMAVEHDENVEIKWEVACQSGAETKDGKIEVLLSDGSREECDLLVVADGASSKLRSVLLPEDGLNYAGAVIIGGQATFPNVESIPKPLTDGVGPLLGGDGHGLVIFQTDATSWVWFVTRREPHPAIAVRGEEALKMKDEIVRQALNEGRVFAEPFPTLVAHTDPSSLKIMNAQDKPPIAHSQLLGPNSNVVFVGDANHAISPFGGNGANMALRDGVALARALCDAPNVASAVEAFDKDCIPRCKSTLKKSHIMIRFAHSTGWLLWLALMFTRLITFLFPR